VDAPGEEALAAELVSAVVRSAVERGEIDIASGSDDEIRMRTQEYIASLLETDFEVDVTIDHGSDLLTEARKFRDSGKPEYAIMFYATWVEHWLNGSLVSVGRRLGLEDAEVLRLLYKPILDKAGVSWRRCFGTPFPQRARARIKRLSELRNDFVHYKWKAVPEDRGPHDEYEALLGEAEELVEELDSLYDSTFFSGQLARLLPGGDLISHPDRDEVGVDDRPAEPAT
jgi:hypothetical protein